MEEKQQQGCLEEEIEVSVDTDFLKQIFDEELSEVVVSGEVNKPNEVVVIDVDDDDDGDGDSDDCVVLDGDPENQVKCVNDSPTGSDELCVVGEKGKIACRDYPHPRHLCANFPYSSTPHEKHCGQCHCYVCDSPAPCLKWGNGLLPTDHCHATDKLETWKTQRNDTKLVKTAPLPASTKYGTSGGVVNSQHNNVLPLHTTQLSSNSVPTNQALRSTAVLSANPIPQSQATQLITMNGHLLNHLQAIQNKQNQLLNQAKSNFVSANTLLQNQVSQPITMNAHLQNQLQAIQQRHNQLLNQASRLTKSNPLPVNLIPQNYASQPVTMNAMSSLNSILPNQASVRNPLLVNPMSQNQAIQPRTTNALSSLNARLQDQLSMLKNICERSTASNFTIPNSTTNGQYKKSRSTVARNKNPSNTVPMSLGVQNHAIQKKRAQRVCCLGPQCSVFNGIDSVGAGNTVTTNQVTLPGASGFNNHVNPQYNTRYPAAAAAATGSSNSRNCYGQNGVMTTKAINSLLTQPIHNPAPAYGTQPCYQSNNSQNPYGYSNILGNDSISSTVARLNQNRNLNEHQIGSQNGNGGGNIINSGTTLQDFLAKGSSWAESTNQNISNVQNLVSKNMPPNGNESRLTLDEIEKHLLLDSN
ncbi:unnamed protein product [Trifolium pratense]|uniref:Uncharacterized protein n=1 Tax=Trifolium pratense TaxID=57577 RepID=A0ACB0ILM8_TRIPR|nr:unnamed protein product [Trifolium pratense]